MTKRAVVVGVNDYSILDPTGKSNLSQCVSDAASVYHMLKNAFDFGDIYYYSNLTASRGAILNALRHLLTISEAGDTVCFYFSGHGARVRADLSKADCDTYYEALVPASGAWITDRDLLQLTSRLSPDYVNFTVITDACHSGGLHPADASIKCRVPSFSDDLLQTIVRYLKTLIPCGICLSIDSSELAHNVDNVRLREDGTIDLDPDPDKILVAASKATLLAACRFNELSWESSQVHHGLFTQTLLDIASQSNFQSSYHNMMEQVRSGVIQKIGNLIQPHHPGTVQTPQLFGQRNRMDEDFLAGWTTTPAVP